PATLFALDQVRKDGVILLAQRAARPFFCRICDFIFFSHFDRLLVVVVRGAGGLQPAGAPIIHTAARASAAASVTASRSVSELLNSSTVRSRLDSMARSASIVSVLAAKSRFMTRRRRTICALSAIRLLFISSVSLEFTSVWICFNWLCVSVA